MTDRLDDLLAEVHRRLDVDDARPRRLFHGRGHCFPGLEDVLVDRFGAVLLVTLHGERSTAWLGRLVEGLLAAPAAGATVTGIMVQHRHRPNAPAEVLWGEVPDTLEVEEAGLRFRVRPGRNQNVGLFLDMAGARAWVRGVAGQARVLNLFAFTCAFSVAALAGGARQVVNVDMSRSALAFGRDNHRCNDQDPSRVVFLAHDVRRSWGKLRRMGPWDLIILDPPTYQPGSFDVERQYPAMLGRLRQLCAPGGRVLACLNSPFLPAHFVDDQMARQAPHMRLERRLDAGEDFPEMDPDRGLKLSIWRAPGG